MGGSAVSRQEGRAAQVALDQVIIPSARVAVCVATLQRPRGLEALLNSLSTMSVPGGIDVVVAVVDNDPAGSARAVVDSVRAQWPHSDLRYAIQEKRGIPFARNRAVAQVLDADWIAFVDDDEIVHADWLTQLLLVAAQTNADVVTGRVTPDFQEQPPPWVLNGEFFERRRFPTGTQIPFARTSNALVAAHWLVDSATPFNEGMANNGGDDTHFFQRVRLGGGRIVWADEAVVVESIPPSRVTPRWLIQREYRRGNTLSLCLRDLEDSPRRRVKRCAAAGYHATAGVLTMVSAVYRGRTALVRGCQRVAFGAGLVTGLTGHIYEEYVTIHGS